MYFVHPQFKNFKLFLKKVSEAKLKQRLAKFFPEKDIVFTDLGRSAFQLAIQHLKLENSEMLMPGYICDIFKPILKKYNIEPTYLDIDLKTFNIDPETIERKITPQTKSILVCHTYGLPVKMDKILEIAKKHNLKVIEDCAHIFSVKTSGDCAFFSFSKIAPSINGAMLVCDKEIRIRLLKYRFRLKNVIKFLRLFPIVARISERFRKTYEKTSKINIPRKASKRSLNIFNWYLNQNKEKELIEYFHKKLKEKGIQSTGITYISALVPNRDELFNKLRKKGIFCSRIWHKPLFPNLPNTSEAAKRIITFPFQSWYKKKDIDKIISCI